MIRDILVTNHTSGVKTKYFLFTLPSNMTVWELIIFIAQNLNKSPLKIELRSVNPKIEFKPIQFSKSLSQVGLTDKIELSIGTPSTFLSQFPLINKMSLRLVREAEQIFTKWFYKFSIPVEQIDPVLLERSTPASRYMTKETAVMWLTEIL